MDSITANTINVIYPKPEIGDFLLWKGYTILSKIIEWFMSLYMEERHIKSNWTGSHAGSFLDSKTIGEAVYPKYKLNSFEKDYENNKGWVVMTPIVPLTEKQKNDAKNEILLLNKKVITYQYWNFLQWPIYILTFGHINLFGKGGIFAVYCFEASARVINTIYPGEYPNPEITSFYDLYLNKKFKIKFDNR